ncbi:lysM and putative peptidoglycan-binding domain-containing protein 3 [Belonocnema kinseyi]|uniref:lysM and putative peptidoglycan-binding domain-containing protein 3 n=1 Tax=Belonocnema kinseyi TaxID=2817044 RepID=UPI00143CC953|nr:lysM and putative peptidoglycan-binding domain-containing protein 3 [Belonocnema kinseyi]
MRKKSNGGSNDRPKSGRQSVYQRGSQRDASPHYVLLYSDDEQSGDEENISLQNRSQSHSSPRKVEVIKIQLQPDDTLPALALKYRCTVSELKRINNIHKDNEIFAHRSIKVPVQPFSILTETLNKIPDGEDKNCIYELESPSTLKEEKIFNLVTTPIVVAPQRSEINNIILNSILEPLPTNETSENVEDAEDVQLLSPSEREKTPKAHLNDTFSCSGADWGLSWPQLLGVSLLLGLAGPIIYIFYIADASNHHSSSGH